jgi:hypothetical protein
MTELLHVGTQVVEPVHSRSPPGALVRNPRNAAQPVDEKRVGRVLDPGRDLAIRRAARGRIVLEPAGLGGIVRGRGHDAVGEAVRSAVVVGKNRLRHDRRRREPIVRIEHDVDAVGRQHLQGTHAGGLGERMRVPAHEQRAVDLRRAPIAADRLRDGENVRFIESDTEGEATMARGAECHAVFGGRAGSGRST